MIEKAIGTRMNADFQDSESIDYETSCKKLFSHLSKSSVKAIEIR